MKKIIILLLITSFLFACTQKRTAQQEQHANAAPVIEAVAYSTGNGWGYTICINGKLFIKQPYIPAIEGVKGFTTKEDAEKTAQYIVKKLKADQQPAITKKELKKLNII